MRVLIPWPAAPTANQTILLFNTHPKVVTGGSSQTLPPIAVPAARVVGVEIVWHRNNQASAANGIRVYALDDADAWRETDVKDDNGTATVGAAAPQAVAALASPAERRILIDLARYRGSAVEYTAGATGPTQWNGTIFAILDDGVIIR